MTTITQADIDASQARVKDAASKGYDAFNAATKEHKQLLAVFAAQQPERKITVTGKTFPHRDTLKAMGLRWDAGLHAWTGTVRGQIKLPAGCYETTQADAALASMDYASSAY